MDSFSPAGLAIFKRVQPFRQEQLEYDSIQCPNCLRRWRLGQCLCMACREPLHARSVNDLLPRFEQWEVDGELRGRYGIGKRECDIMQREVNADCVPMPWAPYARHAPPCGATSEG